MSKRPRRNHGAAFRAKVALEAIKGEAGHRGAARKGLSKYFEFYNSRRRHQSLDRMTPDKAYWTTLPERQVAA